MADLEHQAQAENKLIGAIYECISAEIEADRIHEVVRETLIENGLEADDA